jgi:RNase P subunit RPR2
VASSSSGWSRKRPSAAQQARVAVYRSAEHRAMRRALKAEVDAGRAVCCRCRRPIVPGSAWHADHTEDRRGYLGAAHASCNVRAAARKGAQQRNARASRSVTAVTQVRL